MRYCLLLAMFTACSLAGGAASAQLVRTIENHDPDRPPTPRPKPRPVATASGGASPHASASPRPSPRVAPPRLPVDYNHTAVGNGAGLAPTPNVARWRGRTRDRTLGRSDQVWFGNGGWRCRRDDGTTGTIWGINPGDLLYRYANMSGKQTLGAVAGASHSAAFARQLDSGIVMCR